VPPSFLNSREDAILLWVLVAAGFLIYKDARGIGSALWKVVRAFCTTKLLLLFGSAALYSALVVLLAAKLGFWHTSALRETVYWFLGTAFILVGDATTASPDERLLRTILRRALAFTIVIEFAVNLYVFPLIVEVVLVALIVLFVGMQAVAQHDPKVDPPTRKVINGVLLAFGVFLLGSFAIRALFDRDGFLSRETAERFLVVPVLTLALIPFLYLVAWYSRRELENLRARFAAARSG
jgi:hypothetical protein